MTKVEFIFDERSLEPISSCIIKGYLPMSVKDDVLIDTIDCLALALANYGHQWSPNERSLYEESMRLLGVDEEDLDSSIVKAHD